MRFSTKDRRQNTHFVKGLQKKQKFWIAQKCKFRRRKKSDHILVTYFQQDLYVSYFSILLLNCGYICTSIQINFMKLQNLSQFYADKPKITIFVNSLA